MHLASRFKDYTFPVVPIVTDDLETVVMGFERINTRAKKLTQFDIAHALGRKRKVDVAGLFRDVRARLETTGWMEVEDQVLGYAAKLAVDLQVYSSNTNRFIERLEQARDLSGYLGEAMVQAVTFLRMRCGVHGPRALPYQFQLVLLTELFRRHAQTPFPALEEGAERWFWMTTFSEHFASQRRIQFALQQLVALAQGEQPPRIVDDPHVDPIGEIKYPRARVKGFLLWFAKTFDPLDSSGESLRVPHELGVRGHEVVHALVPRDRCPPALFACAGNVLLCPPEAVLSSREALLLRCEHCPDNVLNSHGIVGAAREALLAGRFVDFVRARQSALDMLERAFVTPLGLDYVSEPIHGDDDT